MRVNFDISQQILEWSELDVSEPPTPGSSIIQSAKISERRQILQRSLNLREAAEDLLDYVRSNGRTIRGDKASQTSSEAVTVSPTEGTSVINSVSNLASIQSGTFTVNGKIIEVDITSDSLEDVISKINNSGAGVKASFNYSTNELTLASLRSGTVHIENGSAAFFSTLNIEDGIFGGDEGFKLEEFLTSSEFQTRLSRFTTRFNKLLEMNFNDTDKDQLIYDQNERQLKVKLDEDNLKEELQAATLNAIKDYIDDGFESGAVELKSAVELVLTDNLLYFSQSKVSFDTDEDPQHLFSFIEDTNGFLSQTINITNRHSIQLQQELNNGGTTGLMIGEDI